MKTESGITKPKRLRRSPSQWQVIIDQFERSGQSQSVFCAEQSLALSSFHRWRQRLARLSRPSACHDADFIELSDLETPVPAPPFPSAHWDVELQLAADVILRLRHQC